jgi:hypothetical protein
MFLKSDRCDQNKKMNNNIPKIMATKAREKALPKPISY